jgi:heat shock protein HslJ
MIFVISMFIFSCKPVMQQGSLPTQLEGTRWLLAGMADRDLLKGGQVTLAFSDGMVHGTDGCNRYSASYVENKDTLIVSENMIMTKMACLEEVMNQGENFLKAVRDTKKFRREGQTLILIDANDQERVTLKEQKEDH